MQSTIFLKINSAVMHLIYHDCYKKKDSVSIHVKSPLTDLLLLCKNETYTTWAWLDTFYAESNKIVTWLY